MIDTMNGRVTESWLRAQPGVEVSQQLKASSGDQGFAGAIACDVASDPSYEKLTSDKLKDVAKRLSDALYPNTLKEGQADNPTNAFNGLVCRLDDDNNVASMLFGVTGQCLGDSDAVEPSSLASAMYYGGGHSVSSQFQLSGHHLLVPLPEKTLDDAQKVAKACNNAYGETRTAADKIRGLFGKDKKSLEYAAALVVSSTFDNPSEVFTQPAVSVFVYGRLTDIARAVRVARVIGGRGQSSATLCTPEGSVSVLDLQSYTNGVTIKEEFKVMSQYYAALPDATGNHG